MAKTCPQAVQLDVLQPCEPLPRSSFMEMLGREGKDYEVEVFGLLAAAVPGAVVIDRDLSTSAREALTLGAMGRGVPLVIGGRLPVDDTAHRVGEPDLLVRADALDPSTTGLGYLPVDVKHHGTLQPKRNVDADGAVDAEDVVVAAVDPHAASTRAAITPPRAALIEKVRCKRRNLPLSSDGPAQRRTARARSCLRLSL